MPSVRHRVSLLHKGGFLIYGAAGADIPSRILDPSSAIQLPILAALHAGRPTLFPNTIHDLAKFVKREKELFLSIERKSAGAPERIFAGPQPAGSKTRWQIFTEICRSFWNRSCRGFAAFPVRRGLTMVASRGRGAPSHVYKGERQCSARN